MSSAVLADVWPDDELEEELGAAWDEANIDTSVIRPHVEYQRDFIGWCVDKMGIPRRTLVWSINQGYEAHQWDGTPDPLVVIARALERWDEREEHTVVAMESATGTGKTFVLGLLSLWFAACFENSLVILFAPTADTLSKQVFKEIGKLFPRFQKHFPSAELTTRMLRMRGGIDESWTISGKGTKIRAGEESTVSAQGFHAEHMLIIGDETPGMAIPTLTAHENTCTGPHNLRIYAGNPDHEQDALHTIAVSPGAVAVRISGLDHPNVVCDDATIVPGAVSRRSIRSRLRKYKTEDHILYQSRVRGICPPEAQNALIKARWVRRAIENGKELRFKTAGAGVKSMGADVANSEAGDKAARAYGIGACLTELVQAQCPDANVFGRELVELARARGVLPRHVGVDAIGVGAGAVNEAKRIGFRLVALYSGNPVKNVPTMDASIDVEGDETAVRNVEQFVNLRAQMGWQAADDLMHERVAIDIDEATAEELLRDLIAATWSIRNGAILMESKEEIIDRLGRSPNLGDAFTYWNWVRPRLEVKPDPDENEISVWDPAVLAAEAESSRKLKPRMQRRRERLRSMIDHD